MSSNERYSGTGPGSAPAHRQRGLTLIELLVAISVLAFVAVLGWRGLDGIVRARIALNADLEQTRGMQLAFAQMQNDFAQIVTGSTVPDRAPVMIDQNRVTLIRKVHADNQPTRLQVVTYRVRNGVLVRRESMSTRDLTELDALWAAAENDEDDGQDVALQSGVIAMTMRLWGSNGWGEVNANPEAPETSATTARMSKGAMERSVGIPAATGQSESTGLQVALQLEGRGASMLKIFLLGAV
jgi:general secretion pathway protein J